MRRSTGRQWVVLGFFVGLFNSPFALAAHATGFVEMQTFPKSPSLPKKPEIYDSPFSCYVFRTSQRLDCPLTYSAVGVVPPESLTENNGGHAHAGHPLLDTASTDPLRRTLQFSGTDKDPSPLVVQGSTQYTEVRVIHPLPQVSGKIVTEARVFAPPGWYCVERCFTHNSWKYKNTFDIGIQGLTKLPASSAFHIVVRGGTTEHPEGTWGTLDTVGRAVYLAYEYFKVTGRRLSINDLSLPKGGLFDINNNWDRPHGSHRTGTDMDLNKADAGGIAVNCEDDSLLDEAIDTAHSVLPPIVLLCESQGRKHVHFD